MPIKVTLGLVVLALTVSAFGVACGGDENGALKSGSVVATEGGLEGGRIWFIWEGTKQRIQQPAGMTEDDVQALGYTQGELVTGALTVGDSEDSRWVVFPPAGPDARLWLVYDNVMHQVSPEPADTAEVEALPDAEGLIITRLRMAGD